MDSTARMIVSAIRDSPKALFGHKHQRLEFYGDRNRSRRAPDGWARARGQEPCSEEPRPLWKGWQGIRARGEGRLPQTHELEAPGATKPVGAQSWRRPTHGQPPAALAKRRRPAALGSGAGAGSAAGTCWQPPSGRGWRLRRRGQRNRLVQGGERRRVPTIGGFFDGFILPLLVPLRADALRLAAAQHYAVQHASERAGQHDGSSWPPSRGAANARWGASTQCQRWGQRNDDSE